MKHESIRRGRCSIFLLALFGLTWFVPTRRAAAQDVDSSRTVTYDSLFASCELRDIGSGARSFPGFHLLGTTVAANRDYRAWPLREFFLGEGYRDVWAVPVEVPLIDLERTAGGLTLLQRGGGLQTVSLRMQVFPSPVCISTIFPACRATPAIT